VSQKYEEGLKQRTPTPTITVLRCVLAALLALYAVALQEEKHALAEQYSALLVQQGAVETIHARA